MATRQIKPLRGSSVPWMVVYRGTGDTSDGLVESPFSLTGFDDDRMWWPADLYINPTATAPIPWEANDDSPYPNATHRLFYTKGTELQLMPLFSVDSSTALIQLWGFDLFQRIDDRLANRDPEYPEPRPCLNTNNGAKTDLVLGEAHNIARNDPGAPRTIPMVARDELWTIESGLAMGDLAYRDQNGESFARGETHLFPVDEFGAFMVNVPILSAGELILLARFVEPNGRI